MRHFCTYFDINYLPRALAMYGSLAAHCPRFQLWVLCMDAESHSVLTRMALPHVHPIRLEDFERGDGSLAASKANRSRIEYYFTCTASLPLYVFRQCPEAELVTYLDADMYFFQDPEPIYAEMGERSVLMIAHRFPPDLQDRAVFGIYNVGFLAFRRDMEGLACLEWWRERCLEWCYDRLEGDRFADQKYLDQWPRLFPQTHVLQHPGAGLAPWNLANYQIEEGPDGVCVDGQPLILYHFHGCKQVGRFVYETGLKEYRYRLNPAVRRAIYRPYLEALLRAAGVVRGYRSAPTAAGKTLRYATSATSPLRRLRSLAGQIVRSPRNSAERLVRLARGEFLVALGERVW